MKVKELREEVEQEIQEEKINRAKAVLRAKLEEIEVNKEHLDDLNEGLKKLLEADIEDVAEVDNYGFVSIDTYLKESPRKDNVY